MCAPGETMSPSIATIIVAHDDVYALRQAVESVADISKVFVFISRKPWYGEPGDWKLCREMCSGLNVSVVEGDWLSESTQRRVAIDYVKAAGFEYCIFLDSDEVLDPVTATRLKAIAESQIADRVYVKYHTYWKGSQFLVKPQEGYEPLVMMSLQGAAYTGGREASGGESLRLGSEMHGVHHFGYCGSDERVAAKIKRWRHGDLYVSDWFVRSWQGWDRDVLKGNLHPTVPHVYSRLEMVEEKPFLSSLKHQVYVPDVTLPRGVSIVIPLHGGRDDLRRCLDSIAKYAECLHEVIVVDDCSPDDAASAAAENPWIKVVQTDQRLGFAGACNTGIAASSGNTILFLNSDTVVPFVSICKLIEALHRDVRIGAAGPYSNHSHEYQIVRPLYSDLRFLEEFASLFAIRTMPDEPTDMLSGFCLAVKREVLDEVGGFDESFGSGTWEDNDLCYRIVRSGRYLVRVSTAYIHHSSGSPSLSRTGEDTQVVFEANKARFQAKWTKELESGFASGLSGLTKERIRFNRNRGKAKRPLASAVCCTFARPRQLEEAIECFLRQDYEPKEMVILNDHPDHELVLDRKYPGVRIVNAAKRFKSLGEKRNAAMALASGEYLFIWDDDDLSLPWRMKNSIDWLEQFPEYEGVRGTTSLFSTNNTDYTFFGGVYGQGCFRRAFFDRVKYEEGVSCGEDWRFEEQAMMFLVDPAPFYWMVCRWGLGIYHISGIGEYDHERNWEQAGKEGFAATRGKEFLQPRFHHDYWSDVAEFLASNLPETLKADWQKDDPQMLSRDPHWSKAEEADSGKSKPRSDTSART